MNYLIILIIAVTLIGELLARAWRAKQGNPFMQAPIYRSSDILPWELQPNSRWSWTSGVPANLGDGFYRDIEVNSLGYREREFSWQKPPDTYRVLFLGDSYVLGWGVSMEETVGRQLESLLQPRFPSKRVEVINAAFACAYSPDTYYVYLKQRGLSLQPDLVISTFLPRGDLKEMRLNERVTEANGLPGRVISKIDSVDDRTHLRRRMFPSRVPLQVKRVSALLDWSVRKIRPFILGHGDQDALQFLHNPHAGGYGDVWPVAAQCLSAAHRLLQSQPVPLPYLVVIIPEPHEVYPEFWKSLGLPFDRELYWHARPQQEAMKMAEKEGFSCLDLLPGFRKFGEQEVLYFNSHAHWNQSGHRRAAELIAQSLHDTSFCPTSGLPPRVGAGIADSGIQGGLRT